MTAKRIFLALILTAVAAISVTALRAQSNDEPTLTKRIQPTANKAERLEGSWTLTVTAVVPPGVPPPPVRHAGAAFANGGTAILSDRQAPFANPAYGVWEHEGGNEFLWTFTGDNFDAMGNFLGTLKVRAKLSVTGADEFVGVDNAEFRDAAGNLLFSACNTIRGERINIEPLPAQCQSITPPQ